MKNNETCSNCCNATDWNGDGEYGKFSDQFIELHNLRRLDQHLKLGTLMYRDGEAPLSVNETQFFNPENMLQSSSTHQELNWTITMETR